MRHRTVGLWEYDRERATPGFTLLSPQNHNASYLINMDGAVVHGWQHPLRPGDYAYLLPGGHLLWAGETEEGPHPAPGKGGLLREYDWDGNVVWEYRDDRQHHDFRRLSNGNTAYIGWEPMSAEAAARVPGAEPGSEDPDGVMWGDFIQEVNSDGKVVWEWHVETGMELEKFPFNPLSTRREFAHANALSETLDGDLMVSFRKISTIAIIDKQTGKLRWHQRDEDWGQQHDCQMLPNGNILFFANGIHVPRGVFYSRVIELDPASGKEVWSYRGSPANTFFSPNISGAQRQPTGNTLICEGINGRILEVTPAGEIVWEYISPWFGLRQGGLSNSVFRAYRYAADSAEIEGRLGRP